MLGAIRNKSKGWVAYLIVGLITVPFALFGIQDYASRSANTSIAKVHNIERTGSPPDEYHAKIDGIFTGKHFPGHVVNGDFLGVIAVPV